VRFLREVFLDVRRTWHQRLLAGVGLTLAVLALVAIYTTGVILRQVLVANSEQKFGRLPTVANAVSVQTVSGSQFEQFMSDVAIYISDRGSHYALTTQVGSVSATTAASGTVAPSLVLVAGQLNGIRRVPLVAGRWFGTGRQIYPGGVVVNQAGEGSLGGVGATVYLQTEVDQGPIRQRIVGVVADGNPDPTAYASMASVLTARPASLDGASLTVYAHDTRLGLTALENEVTKVSLAMGALPIDVAPIEVDQVAQVYGEENATENAFVLATGVALVIATVGLISIGLASVAERSRELTIRRAVGATRLRTFALVMASSITVGLFACGSAVIAGILAVVLVVPHLLDKTLELSAPAFPWIAAEVGIYAGFGAAILGGLIPALRAVGVDLAGALRE
jgi:hypothetical protein